MESNWYHFQGGYVSAVNLQDAKNYAYGWRMGKYIERAEPGKDNTLPCGVTDEMRERNRQRLERE